MTRASNPLIIGLFGKARSGKDTAAETINLFFGAKRFAFADKVKEVVQVVFGVTIQQQNHPALKEKTLGAAYPNYSTLSPRSLAQLVGTECFRATFGPNVWINALDREIFKEPRKIVVITDVRFQQESDWVIENGGYIIHLTRPQADGNVGVPSHSSEAGIVLDFYPHERIYTCANNGTLEELRSQVKEITSHIVEHFQAHK